MPPRVNRVKPSLYSIFINVYKNDAAAPLTLFSMGFSIPLFSMGGKNAPLLNFWSAKGMNLKILHRYSTNHVYFSKIEKKFNDFVIFCWRQQKFGNFGQYYRTSLNVCKMRTKAYFSILFSLTVYKKPKFSKKYGVPRFFPGNADFSLPEFPEVPDVGKIRKFRKIQKIRYFSNSLIGIDYYSKFQV